jgi:hypothetical protein
MLPVHSLAILLKEKESKETAARGLEEAFGYFEGLHYADINILESLDMCWLLAILSSAFN